MEIFECIENDSRQILFYSWLGNRWVIKNYLLIISGSNSSNISLLRLDMWVDAIRNILKPMLAARGKKLDNIYRNHSILID